ncbi:MAG: tRNA (guanosine(46)-N7)-methyltransferase TrmB [Gammaproteobacteria bacterium]|nr:tRNA (guanosine(46)-N7)-methyltransferase TrmB [Gammaproteobacteria bacterium]
MTTTPDVEHPRTIRSYVIRGGRLTNSQQHALDNYWSKYGIDDVKAPLDCAALFGRQAPVVMEIGFGMGDSLLAMARGNPDKNFIGVEVHKPGVGRLLHEIDALALSNLRIYCHDAKEILQHCIADNALDTVQIFFPDPWHKKKHNKRRLVQPEFMQLVRQKLVIGGRVHMATDWVPYAEHMMEVMSAAPGYVNASGAGLYSADAERPVTKFEKRGHRLGHAVHDLMFVRAE